MEDRGIFNGRGFWALALLWLPAGVVAQALVRFLPETGPQADFSLPLPLLLMLAGSLVLVAPCGLPAGARLPARVAARIPACSRLGLDHARCGDSGGDGGGGAARSDRDRALRDSVQPSRVGGLVVARTPRLTAPRRLRAGQERIWYAGGVPAGPAAHCP